MNRVIFAELMDKDFKLSEEERKEIIENSIERNGRNLKCVIVMEELAELQKEVSKYIRNNGSRTGLLEEMADVYVSLATLESLFEVDKEEIQKAIDIKLERLRRKEEGAISNI